MRRLSVPVETGFDASSITASGDAFKVSSRSSGVVTARSVIVACGGKTYPAFGSDGNGYKFAEGLGHTIIKPVPAAVALNVNDPLFHRLQGQKIEARAESLICGKPAEMAEGDVLFTKYGLSGTAILDISESVSIAINRSGLKNISVRIDMVPFMDEAELAGEFAKRGAREPSNDEMIAGILPNKFGPVFGELFRTNSPGEAAKTLKGLTLKVSGTRGWNEAEFTAGGVAAGEIDPAGMGSKLEKNIFFTGEILDVNGKRGGYNLAWAWASGFIAGEQAAKCAS
jgi:predicted Rossmann fold flavoprotein